MHFLCSTFGSSGDVFPMMGLALELHRRGFPVTFATNEHYAELARRHGLAFEPLGTEAEFQAAIAHPDLWHPRRSFQHVFTSFAPALRRQYQLHAELAEKGPVVGLATCLGFGARMAQERLGIPVLTVHYQPAVLWSDVEPPRLPGLAGPPWLRSVLYRLAERIAIDPVVGAGIDGWRRELGLAPIRRVTRWWNSPTGVMCLFPAWYAPRQPDWPPDLIQVDFPLWNEGSDAELPAEVEAFLSRGEPPVVATPGSANAQAARFFAAVAEGCRASGRRAILLTRFPDQLPKPLPEGVAWFEYVPLDRLLPRASAFIHHGGIGSAAQAMAAATPQLVMPLAHDQFDNAERIHQLGVGDWIRTQRFTAPRVARGLERLIGNRRVTEACAALAGRLRSRDGIARAADAIITRFH